MDFHIDFSIMTSTKAVGYISGILSLAAVPSVGSTIVLWVSNPSVFIGYLQVERVHFYPLQQNTPTRLLPNISLSISDLVLPSVDAAKEVANLLSSSFNLFFEEYDLPEEL